MSWRQKLHFVWLVLMNTQRIIDNCEDLNDGSRVIQRATDKRATLGLPMGYKRPDRKKRRDISRMLVRTAGFRRIPGHEVMHDNGHYLEEPY